MINHVFAVQKCFTTFVHFLCKGHDSTIIQPYTHKRVCSPAFASLPQATSRPQLKIRVDSFWKTRPDYLRLFNSAAEQCFVQCRRYA